VDVAAVVDVAARRLGQEAVMTVAPDPPAALPPPCPPEPAASLPIRRAPRPPILARITLAILTALTTGCGVWGFMKVIGSDGVDVLDLLLLPLFTLLFLWVAFSFWTASLGFIQLHRHRQRASALLRNQAGRGDRPLPRTALLMPVYNESPADVYAGLVATCESLRATGQAGSFDLFILSDTRDPRVWLEEELMWASLAASFGHVMGVYYRRRERNTGKKSGNIAEFLRRWGGAYEYMIVFDADSVMSGSTVVEMARRMEDQPDLGILQAVPLPVMRESFFARMQQFAASAYGDVYAAGLACWTGLDGNYYGHNAIIRVKPFIEHCALPKLPGEPPLGGEVLSHDFVEAAMMRRAGWKVGLAHDLGGSYEQCPTTLIDFAQRDQRWCQGNLQHTRIVLRHGLHPVSRIHLFSGIMSYLSAPLWLAFMVLGVAQEAAHRAGWLSGWSWSWWPATDWPMAWGLGLLAATMMLLLLPKFWGLLTLEMDPVNLFGHGGQGDATASALLETFVSILLAPVMMAFHSRFVLATLTGHKVHWGKQRRDAEGTSFQEALRAHGGHTAAGIVAMLVLAAMRSPLLLWMLPVLLGLMLSIPLSMLLGSANIGRALRKQRFFMMPEETFLPPVLRRQMHALESYRERQNRIGSADPLIRVVVEPAFHALHLSILRQTAVESDAASAQARSEVQQIDRTGLERLSPADAVALLSSQTAMRHLHRHAWSHWPLEQLGISALRAELPAVAPPIAPFALRPAAPKPA
jgi:membrane glycosyltransferase